MKLTKDTIMPHCFSSYHVEFNTDLSTRIIFLTNLLYRTGIQTMDILKLSFSNQ